MSAPAPPPRARERRSGLWARFSRSHARAVAAGILGGGAAAAYAHFIGCRTGTCPLTSNVWVAAIYGTTVGALVGWPNRTRERREAAAADRG